MYNLFYLDFEYLAWWLDKKVLNCRSMESRKSGETDGASGASEPSGATSKPWFEMN